MLTIKQLEHLSDMMDKSRLEIFLNTKDGNYLSNIKQSIDQHVLPKNGLTQPQREKYLSVLSYVESHLNGITQRNQTDDGIDFIDTSQLKQIATRDLIDTLGITIKKDEINKLITFMTCLSAYTEDSQLNLSYNAPSSSGKSYIPVEIARLFPSEDIIEVGYCSPTAFFHSYGQFDKEKEGYIVDLSKKALIFLDQPHQQLLEHLRPLLSHDKKEIVIKVTDKSQKFGLKTKNIYLLGYPAVIFCTAGLKIDEQEATRFLLLSPELTQEKIRESVLERINRDADKRRYNEQLNMNGERLELMTRIKAVRQANISDVVIKNTDLINKMFFERVKKLKPKHQRDIGRLIGFTKLFALINLWFRERDHDIIYASDADIYEAFVIWDDISASQELNLPPYIYNFFFEVIVEAYKDKNDELDEFGIGLQGLSKAEIQKKNYELTGRFLPDWQLRQQIFIMLETAGLIRMGPDPNDKRRVLVYPNIDIDQKYSELNGGVNDSGGDDDD